MWRKAWLVVDVVLLLGSVLLFGSAAEPSAQSARAASAGVALVPPFGGPDLFGYTYDATVPFNWVDVSGGAPVPGGDDCTSGPFNIGFTFSFYGVNYSQFWISTNGMLMFAGQTSHYHWVNTFIPSAAVPNNYVAPFWDDLRTYGGTWIRYQTFGSAPSRYLVVEWHAIGHYWGGGEPMTFEVILCEGSNHIKFQYLDMLQNSRGDGQEATIGIENQDGDGGLAYSYDEVSITDGQAIFFYHPAQLPSPTPTGVPLYGGPDAFGYTWDRQVPYGWIDATSGVMVPWTYDINCGPFDIGFPFDFYGTTYNQFYIGKGMVLFGAPSYKSENQCVPSPGVPNSFAAAFWDDIGASEMSGHLYYKTLGRAPHRALVVQWYNIGFWLYSDTMTFEVVLYEGSNDIKFHYQSLAVHALATGSSATIGIENQNGTIGSAVSCDKPWLYPGAAVRFHHPGAPPTSTPTRTATATRTHTPTRTPPGWTPQRVYLPVMRRS